MMPFLKIVAAVINGASVLATLLLFAFGLYEFIMGPADAKRMLEKLRCPLSYKQVLILGFTSVVIMLVTGMILKFLF